MAHPPTEAAHPEAAQTGTEQLIHLTPRAQQKAREFLAEEEDPTARVLRVGVDSGGCSGFSYLVQIDAPQEGDHVQDYGDGLKMVCNQLGLRFLRGATIDYVDEVGHAGFKFENPNAQSSCGCGTSFSV